MASSFSSHWLERRTDHLFVLASDSTALTSAKVREKLGFRRGGGSVPLHRFILSLGFSFPLFHGSIPLSLSVFLLNYKIIAGEKEQVYFSIARGGGRKRTPREPLFLLLLPAGYVVSRSPLPFS